MNFLPIIRTNISIKEEKELNQNNKSYNVKNELDKRNFIMQIKKEFEEDQKPINRLKMYMNYNLVKNSLDILNNEWLSNDELYEALAYLEIIKNPNNNDILIRETIHQKIKSLECILK